MKYIKTLVGALLATALLVTVATAAPSTNAPIVKSKGYLDKWTLSLAGGGSTALGGDAEKVGSAVGGEFQLGLPGHFVLPLEAGIRQGVSYNDVNSSTWLLSTKVYSDWTVVKFGNLQFDAGGNVGISYGNTSPTWTIAPEVVSRLYLKKDVDVFTRVEYPFDLNEGKSLNRLTYTFGIRLGF